MPKIGEIKKAHEVGKGGTAKYILISCRKCGKQRWVALTNTKTPTFTGLCQNCRRHQKGPDASGWRGGRKLHSDNYIMVTLEQNDFFYPMCNKQGYVYEHRLVMAKHLNRCLLPWEIVHHKNGLKYDNCLENLQLLPTGRYHLPSMKMQREIKQLKTTLLGQRKEMELLKWQIKELQK